MFDEISSVTFKGTVYQQQHGNPFDRGSADSYYGRVRDPHYYPDGTGHGTRVVDLTPAELQAYHAGYDYNEECGDKKNWN